MTLRVVADALPFQTNRLAVTDFGEEVVREVATRLECEPHVVMRAMMTVSLHHQKELAEVVRALCVVEKLSAKLG